MFTNSRPNVTAIVESRRQVRASTVHNMLEYFKMAHKTVTSSRKTQIILAGKTQQSKPGAYSTACWQQSFQMYKMKMAINNLPIESKLHRPSIHMMHWTYALIKFRIWKLKLTEKAGLTDEVRDYIWWPALSGHTLTCVYGMINDPNS